MATIAGGASGATRGASTETGARDAAGRGVAVDAGAAAPVGEAVGLGAATVAVAVGAGAGLGVSAVPSTEAAGEEAVPAALEDWGAEQALVAASSAAERRAAEIESGQGFIGKPISLPRARFSPGVRSAKRAGVEIVRL